MFFRSIASISNDLSKVASSGANATLALSDIAIQVSRTSASLAKEMWSGIDVEKVVANLQGAKFVIHRSLATQAFFASEAGQEICPLPEEAIKALTISINAVGPELPVVAKVSSFFNVSGAMRELSYRISWLAHHYVVVQVLLINISFNLEWANPCWNILDFDPTAQLPQVASRIRESLDQVQHTSWIVNTTNVAEVAAVQVIRPNYLLEWWYYVRQQYLLIANTP